MKKHFLAAFLFALAAAGTAHAQIFLCPHHRIGRATASNAGRRPPVTRGEAGAIPRAIKGGNPLQMLNPRAPQRYFGHPNDTVTYDQENPSHVTGIILFGIRW